MSPSKNNDTPQAPPRLLPSSLFLREDSLHDVFGFRDDDMDGLNDSTISNESVCEVIDEVLDILSDYEAPNDAGEGSNREERRSGQ
jgi:hypothetical protein